MNSANYHGLIEVNCITPQPSKLVLNSKNSSKSFQKAKTQSKTPSYRPLRETEQTHFTKSHTYFKTQKAKQKQATKPTL